MAVTDPGDFWGGTDRPALNADEFWGGTDQGGTGKTTGKGKTNSDEKVKFLGNISIDGGIAFDGDRFSRHRVLGADLTLEIEQESELRINLDDPNYEYFKSFGKPKGPLGTSAVFEKMKLLVAGVDLGPGPHGQGETILRLRPYGIEKMRDITGMNHRDDLSPTDYVKDAAEHVGMTFVGRQTKTRPTIARDVAETAEGDDPAEAKNSANEWTTVRRLAEEEGYLCFETVNSLYFAPPHWFEEFGTPVDLYFDTPPKKDIYRILDHPSWNLNHDGDSEFRCRVDVNLYPFMVPGTMIKVHGFPTITKRLLVTSVKYPLLGQTRDIEITAKYPWVLQKMLDASKMKPLEETGAGPGGVTMGAVGGNKEMYIKEVLGAVKEKGLGKLSAGTTLSTCLVETEFLMYANSKVPESLKFPHDAVGNDGTSCGLFQQQQNGAWGTLAQNMNARASAHLFLNVLINKSGHDSPDHTTRGNAAQSVQRSGFPLKYAQRMGEADGLVNQYWDQAK